jgi:hypothetical protein
MTDDDQAPERRPVTLAELSASLRPLTREELAESVRRAETDMSPGVLIWRTPGRSRTTRPRERGDRRARTSWRLVWTTLAKQGDDLLGVVLDHERDQVIEPLTLGLVSHPKL